MKTWDRLRLFAVLPLAVASGCVWPSGPDELDDRYLVETHHAIVDGIVLGDSDQPLEGVDIVLRVAGSSLPAPSTRTDGAGSFVLVLAVYNGSVGADSAAATVYAFARPSVHSTSAANHADIVIRFVPKSQTPLRTSVTLKLPVF